MYKRIFKDESLQSLFDKQGFIITPFIDEQEVQALTSLFYELHPNLGKGFVSGSYSPDYGYKRKASDSIVKVFEKHYERLFADYQPFGAAFLYKMPSPESELSVHQDWTIVDENQFVALNCWVPLTDINEMNGALHIVPGSQYPTLHTVRAPTLPFFFSGNDDVVVRESIPMYVKAGSVVILNQSVIHYSPPNKSAQIRLAITAGVKSKGAPMMFHYWNKQENEQQLERFEMPEDFLINFDNFGADIFKRPTKGRSTGWVDFSMPVYSREELTVLISGMKKNAGFGEPV